MHDENASILSTFYTQHTHLAMRNKSCKNLQSILHLQLCTRRICRNYKVKQFDSSPSSHSKGQEVQKRYEDMKFDIENRNWMDWNERAKQSTNQPASRLKKDGWWFDLGAIFCIPCQSTGCTNKRHSETCEFFVLKFAIFDCGIYLDAKKVVNCDSWVVRSIWYILEMCG